MSNVVRCGGGEWQERIIDPWETRQVASGSSRGRTTFYKDFCKYCNISAEEYSKKKNQRNSDGKLLNIKAHNQDCKADDPSFYPDQSSGIPSGGFSLMGGDPQSPLADDKIFNKQVEATRKKEEEARKRKEEKDALLIALDERLRALENDWGQYIETGSGGLPDIKTKSDKWEEYWKNIKEELTTTFFHLENNWRIKLRKINKLIKENKSPKIKPYRRNNLLLQISKLLGEGTTRTSSAEKDTLSGWLLKNVFTKDEGMFLNYIIKDKEEMNKEFTQKQLKDLLEIEENQRIVRDGRIKDVQKEIKKYLNKWLDKLEKETITIKASKIRIIPFDLLYGFGEVVFIIQGNSIESSFALESCKKIVLNIDNPQRFEQIVEFDKIAKEDNLNKKIVIEIIDVTRVKENWSGEETKQYTIYSDAFDRIITDPSKKNEEYRVDNLILSSIKTNSLKGYQDLLADISFYLAECEAIKTLLNGWKQANEDYETSRKPKEKEEEVSEKTDQGHLSIENIEFILKNDSEIIDAEYEANSKGTQKNWQVKKNMVKISNMLKMLKDDPTDPSIKSIFESEQNNNEHLHTFYPIQLGNFGSDGKVIDASHWGLLILTKNTSSAIPYRIKYLSSTRGMFLNELKTLEPFIKIVFGESLSNLIIPNIRGITPQTSESHSCDSGVMMISYLRDILKFTPSSLTPSFDWDKTKYRKEVKVFRDRWRHEIHKAGKLWCQEEETTINSLTELLSWYEPNIGTKEIKLLDYFFDKASKYNTDKHDNPIALDFSPYINCEKIITDGSKACLGKINVATNFELKELSFPNGELIELDLVNNGKLELLDVSNNKLKTLNLSKNNKLKHLNVAENEIDMLALSFDELEEYRCWDLSNLPNLTFLNVAHNNLNSLRLSPQVFIKSFDWDAIFGAKYDLATELKETTPPPATKEEKERYKTARRHLSPQKHDETKILPDEIERGKTAPKIKREIILKNLRNKIIIFEDSMEPKTKDSKRIITINFDSKDRIFSNLTNWKNLYHEQANQIILQSWSASSVRDVLLKKRYEKIKAELDKEDIEEVVIEIAEEASKVRTAKWEPQGSRGRIVLLPETFTSIKTKLGKISKGEHTMRFVVEEDFISNDIGIEVNSDESDKFEGQPIELIIFQDTNFAKDGKWIEMEKLIKKGAELSLWVAEKESLELIEDDLHKTMMGVGETEFEIKGKPVEEKPSEDYPLSFNFILELSWQSSENEIYVRDTEFNEKEIGIISMESPKVLEAYSNLLKINEQLVLRYKTTDQVEVVEEKIERMTAEDDGSETAEVEIQTVLKFKGEFEIKKKGFGDFETIVIFYPDEMKLNAGSDLSEPELIIEVGISKTLGDQFGERIEDKLKGKPIRRIILESSDLNLTRVTAQIRLGKKTQIKTKVATTYAEDRASLEIFFIDLSEIEFSWDITAPPSLKGTFDELFDMRRRNRADRQNVEEFNIMMLLDEKEAELFQGTDIMRGNLIFEDFPKLKILRTLACGGKVSAGGAEVNRIELKNIPNLEILKSDKIRHLEELIIGEKKNLKRIDIRYSGLEQLDLSKTNFLSSNYDTLNFPIRSGSFHEDDAVGRAPISDSIFGKDKYTKDRDLVFPFRDGDLDKNKIIWPKSTEKEYPITLTAKRYGVYYAFKGGGKVIFYTTKFKIKSSKILFNIPSHICFEINDDDFDNHGISKDKWKEIVIVGSWIGSFVEDHNRDEKETISFTRVDSIKEVEDNNDWRTFGSPFEDFTEEITLEWKRMSFSRHQTKDWLEKGGLKAHEYEFANWINDVKELDPPFADLDALRREYEDRIIRIDFTTYLIDEDPPGYRYLTSPTYSFVDDFPWNASGLWGVEIEGKTFDGMTAAEELEILDKFSFIRLMGKFGWDSRHRYEAIEGRGAIFGFLLNKEKCKDYIIEKSDGTTRIKATGWEDTVMKGIFNKLNDPLIIQTRGDIQWSSLKMPWDGSPSMERVIAEKAIMVVDKEWSIIEKEKTEEEPKVEEISITIEATKRDSNEEIGGDLIYTIQDEKITTDKPPKTEFYIDIIIKRNELEERGIDARGWKRIEIIGFWNGKMEGKYLNIIRFTKITNIEVLKDPISEERWESHGVPFLGFSEAITGKWKKSSFSRSQAREWLDVGMEKEDNDLCAWLRDIRKLTPEIVLNNYEKKDLEKEYNRYYDMKTFDEWKDEGKLNDLIPNAAPHGRGHTYRKWAEDNNFDNSYGNNMTKLWKLADLKNYIEGLAPC